MIEWRGRNCNDYMERLERLCYHHIWRVQYNTWQTCEAPNLKTEQTNEKGMKSNFWFICLRFIIRNISLMCIPMVDLYHPYYCCGLWFFNHLDEVFLKRHKYFKDFLNFNDILNIFHYSNQKQTMRRGGFVADLSKTFIWETVSGWHVLVVEVITKWYVRTNHGLRIGTLIKNSA